MQRTSKQSADRNRDLLDLLSAEPVRVILAALRFGPQQPIELQRGRLLAPSTLHRYLSELKRLEALVSRKLDGPAHAVQYELAPAGIEMGRLVRDMEAWLRARPRQPLDPASKTAWKAVITLGEGWSGGTMEQLLERPLSARELGELHRTLSRHQLEGLLGRLRDTGIVAAGRGPGVVTSYALSEWGRRGVGPLAAARRWEHRNTPGRDCSDDVEGCVAGLCLALPLVRPDEAVQGLCEFTVTTPAGGVDTAWAEVGSGRCLRSGRNLSPRSADAWSRGSPLDWLDAVIDRRPRSLQIGGDAALAKRLIEELHEQLLGYGRRAPATDSTR